MKTVLLADDDALALNRLDTILNWARCGYEVVGHALDGAECLEQVEKLRPDILILDIDMPRKSGVEVCCALEGTAYAPKILVLSNYDTFCFVRDAMRHGANNYLLKHQITADILLNELEQLRAQLEAEGAHQQQTHYFAAIAKQQYLHTLVSAGINDAEKHAHMQMQPEFGDGNYLLCVLQVPNFVLMTHFAPSAGSEKLLRSMLSLAGNVLGTSGNGLITYIELGCFAVLFHFSSAVSSQKMQQQADSAMHLLVTNLQKMLSLPCCWIASDVLQRLDNLPAHYTHLEASLTKTSADLDLRNINIEERKDLNNALTALDFPQTQAVLEKIFCRCGRCGALPQQVVAQLLETGLRFQQMQKLSTVPPECLHQPVAAFSAMTPAQANAFVLSYFRTLLTQAAGTQAAPESSDKSVFYTQKILLFIRESYAQDIYLEQLAEALGVSAAHLSRLLKQQTGSTFVETLNLYRLQRAQQLMRDPALSLKQIAQRVGFNSYNYFLQSFKKSTGQTAAHAMHQLRSHENG